MRIAWIGSPSKGGGVGGMCRLFLRELAAGGVSIDVYSVGGGGDLPEMIEAQRQGLRFMAFPYDWDWNSWYGRQKQLAFMMSFAKRLLAYDRLVSALVKEYRARPYDVVIQFSQGELFGLRRYTNEIPIVLFPCVHAAGELEWTRKESVIVRRCEPLWWRLLREPYLAYRAHLQKRDYAAARGVIGMSRRFNALVQRDYGVPPGRQGVIYQPMDMPRVGGEAMREPDGMVRLLFVGRISVRKGLEMIVRAAHQVVLPDDTLELTIIGAGSLWSNYERLLTDLPTNARVRWLKSLSNAQVVGEMQRSDVLLVPSLYEPGGIVVAEALANGMIVLTSDAVGSAENLPDSVRVEFPAGNQEAFEAAMRMAVEKVRVGGRSLRQEANRVARELFDPAMMTRRLLEEVERIVGGS